MTDYFEVHLNIDTINYYVPQKLLYCAAMLTYKFYLHSN